MAYDRVLEERMNEVAPDLYSRKMFGGVGYFQNGNMCCGITGDKLMVRLGPESGQQMGNGVGPFAPAGKAMGGWFTVDQELLAEDDELRAWMERGMNFAASLPPK